jgi:ATP-dependent exoDNAse (exonuclease V) beta subunit
MRNKVISASAGSGKTHRLSLEYISILVQNLEFADFHFERILVITFTRKATAEIRNKIFSQLDQMIYKNDANLIRQVGDLVGFEITDSTIKKLEKVYIKIKTEKDKVRIFTIDATIQRVFKTMIAPIMKLPDFTTSESANLDVWEEIFDMLTTDEHIPQLIKLNEGYPFKNITDIGQVITDLISHRWMFELVKKSNMQIKSAYTNDYIDDITDERDRAIREFRAALHEHCKLMKPLVMQKISENGKEFSSALLVDAKKQFPDINEHNFYDTIDDFLGQKMFRIRKSILRAFCKGSIKLFNMKSYNKNYTADLEDLQNKFLKFVYYQYACPETLQLYEIWETILKKYDEIKLRTGVLSYDDIAYYTYKYLYSPEYSMINPDNFVVENIFYEFLAVRNQYLLIDEFQDTSVLQFMILAPMITELSSGSGVYSDTSVIVVGDEKQSIYGWRNGEKGLLRFMEGYLRTQTESMSTCYRSLPQIVDFVNYLFRDTNFSQFNSGDVLEDWFYDGEIVSFKSDGSGFVANNFFEKSENSDLDPIREFVFQMVLPEIGSDLGEIAILSRKNDVLKEIGKVLGEFDVKYEMEFSHSIFRHPIVSAILCLMRYVCYGDRHALLDFLSAEIVEIDGSILREIALHNAGRTIDLSESTIQLMSAINNLTDSYHTTDIIDTLHKNPLTLCLDIIEIFFPSLSQYQSSVSNETDTKNLYTFISIITDFLNEPISQNEECSEATIYNLDNFLRFVEVSLQKNDKKQVSTSDPTAIKLLTVHKSKGLGFDTVFVYHDATAERTLPKKIYFDAIVDNESFSTFSDFLISMNYHFVLKLLFYEHFSSIDYKKKIEEMNVLYVAMTRAKTNLYTWWIYKQKDLDPKNLTMRSKAVEIAMEYPVGQLRATNDDFRDVGRLRATDEPCPTIEFPTHFLDLYNKSAIEYLPLTPQSDITLPSSQKNQLFGSAVHFYLSFIKHNKSREHKLAQWQLVRDFGNILSPTEIENVLNKSMSFIRSHSDIFSDKWDKIFNEYSIYDTENRLYRIDRLMIDTKNHEIRIIDYKTGSITDDNQIERYIEIISSLPVFTSAGYSISGEYVRVISLS